LQATDGSFYGTTSNGGTSNSWLTYNDLSLDLIRPKQRGKAATPQEFATADAVIRF
jgi:hypothetical protein